MTKCKDTETSQDSVKLHAIIHDKWDTKHINEAKEIRRLNIYYNKRKGEKNKTKTQNHRYEMHKQLDWTDEGRHI